MRITAPMALLLALALSACGPASTTPVTPDRLDCDPARRDAAARWSALADAAREAAGAPVGPETPADLALSALEAHAQALQDTPREVSGEEAMSLSNRMMDGIDHLGAALPDAARERADDAAEALLTDRGRDGARRAAGAAVLAFEAAVRAARPGSTEASERRERAGALADRARTAAEAYERGVPEGDRAADRAEAAALPEPEGPLAALRARATESSRAARQACGVPRTLAVPGA